MQVVHVIEAMSNMNIMLIRTYHLSTNCECDNLSFHIYPYLFMYVLFLNKLNP